MCLRVDHDISESLSLTSELVVTSQRPSLARSRYDSRDGRKFKGGHSPRDGHSVRGGHSSEGVISQRRSYLRGGHISEVVISQRWSYLRGGHITPDAVVGSYCCSFASDRSRK